EYLVYVLNNLVSLQADTYLFPATVDRLLDIAEIIGLEEAKQSNILNSIKSYLQEKIFPLQNQKGGFGFSETIDPLATAENVILAHRLGMNYPNYNLLRTEIEKHWVGNGWAPFITAGINTGSYLCTYYSLAIAGYTGWHDYDHAKIERFLNESLSRDFQNGIKPTSPEDLYYIIMALKTLNGKLT
ncbi:MAG: hypothetical protein NUV31_04500, partial [Dehalococcoidales bacterium]|nr:hypothetical protein [Dehalococcoidales bacterium]